MLPLEGQNAGADQVSEALPLLWAEYGMDRGQGTSQRVSQLGGALDAALAGRSGFGGVEGRPLDRVREFRSRAPIIHLGLCSLNLEFIQDAS